MNKTKKISSIDEYIKMYPQDIQALLQQMRDIIHKAAPAATEAISYGLATFKLNGNLVHFGAFKNHIGFYPTPSGIVSFQKELAKYVMTKGSIHFPLDKPLPVDLITKIVMYRLKQNKVKNK